MQAPSLTIELTDPKRPAGHLILHNDTGRGLRAWETGNSWGDAAWAFELVAGAQATAVRRRPQRYTRNVPAYREVPAGGAERWGFDLADGTWQLPPARGPRTRLAGLYDPPPTPEALEFDVFTGPVRSEPIELPDDWQPTSP